MKGQPRFLTFAWWNLHNFADYVKGRKADARWPKRAEHYEAKRDRVLAGPIEKQREPRIYTDHTDKTEDSEVAAASFSRHCSFSLSV
jgi:hypothetical protein